MLKKRGQITLFIIIGIVLLIGASFIIYINVMKEKPYEQVESKLKFEYEGQKEIHNFVMSCLEPAVIEGLEIMRLQGGYIVIPDDAETITVKDKRNRIVEEKNSGGLHVITDPDSKGNRKPLWIGTDYVDIPSQEFLESQLKMYVEYEMLNCLDYFSVFDQKGYNISLDYMKVSPHFENAVTTDLDFPIHVRKGDVEYDLNDFTYTVPVDWKRILDAATTLSMYEMSSNYLEYFTTQMISLYSGPSADRMPPTAATIGSISCDAVTWNFDDVHAKMMAILYKNIPDIRIDKTNYTKHLDQNNQTPDFYKSMIHDVIDEDMNMNITHAYKPVWGMNFDILPKAGNQLRADITHGTNIPFLSQFCSIKYKFKYYVQYPVLITIDHFNSADIDPITNSYAAGEGYEFSFPMKVVIYGNQKRDFVPRSDTIAVAQGIAEMTAEQMNLPLSQLFCEPDQRNSDNITIIAKDLFTGQKIPNVDIFYHSPQSIGTCFIDSTKDEGISIARYPLCHNCQVNLVQEGYVAENKYLSSDKGEKIFEFRMEPYKELNLKVKQIYLPSFMRYYYETDGFTKERICTTNNYTLAMLSGTPALDENVSGRNHPLFRSSLKDIEADEKAILAIESTNPDKPYMENIIYPLVDKLKLSSGRYSVNAVLNGQSTILPSTQEADDEEITISLHESGSGTYKGIFNVGSINYNFYLGYVFHNDNITLYTLANYLPSQVVDVDRVTKNSIIKNNGLLEYKYNLDHDCNPLTGSVEASVSLDKNNYLYLLQPLVE